MATAVPSLESVVRRVIATILFVTSAPAGALPVQVPVLWHRTFSSTPEIAEYLDAADRSPSRVLEFRDETGAWHRVSPAGVVSVMPPAPASAPFPGGFPPRSWSEFRSSNGQYLASVVAPAPAASCGWIVPLPLVEVRRNDGTLLASLHGALDTIRLTSDACVIATADSMLAVRPDDIPGAELRFFAGDGTRLVTVTDPTPGAFARAVLADRAGTLAYETGDDVANEVRVISPSGAIIDTIALGESIAWSLALSPDGNRIALQRVNPRAPDGFAPLEVHAVGGDLLTTRVMPEIGRIAFSRSGDHVVVSSDDTLTLVQATTDSARFTMAAGRCVERDVAVSNGGGWLVATCVPREARHRGGAPTSVRITAWRPPSTMPVLELQSSVANPGTDERATARVALADDGKYLLAWTHSEAWLLGLTP